MSKIHADLLRIAKSAEQQAALAMNEAARAKQEAETAYKQSRLSNLIAIASIIISALISIAVKIM